MKSMSDEQRAELSALRASGAGRAMMAVIESERDDLLRRAMTSAMNGSLEERQVAMLVARAGTLHELVCAQTLTPARQVAVLGAGN